MSDEVQMYHLIRCFGEYADRACVENLYLRIYISDFRELYYLAKRWKESVDWMELEAIQGRSVDESILRFSQELRAQLFIMIDMLAGTATSYPPEPLKVNPAHPARGGERVNL